MNPANFMVTQELRKYTSALDRWKSQVQTARTPLDAFRIASQEPPRGHLLAGMSGMCQADKMRARRAIAAELSRRLEDIEDEQFDRILPAIHRLSAGHWPEVHAQAERRARLSRSG